MIQIFALPNRCYCGTDVNNMNEYDSTRYWTDTMNKYMYIVTLMYIWPWYYYFYWGKG